MHTQINHLKTFLLQGLICFGIFSSSLQSVRAEVKPNQPAQTQQEHFFEQHVRPLLIKHCIECHGPKKQFAELRLDSRVHLLKGGETGPAIKVKHPNESLLISAVRRESLEMPPEEPLKKEEIEILSTWISQGAIWPETAAIGNTTKVNFAEHWAFQPVQNPSRPKVKETNWPQNDIDYFILSKLDEHHLKPSQPAKPATLLRRISWDLTGLAPSPQQAKRFAESQSPQSIESVIQQQLASPHYGERWGRYWLDLARYADTKGYVFFEKPAFHIAFTYRDYVIQSFNQDKPFNQFILEQLAADSLKDQIPHQSQAALGFITVGPRFKNDIHDIISDRIDVVTRGFLGLTVGCARCHDHKYDPISIEDYYSLYGVFRNSLEPIDLPFVNAESLPAPLKAQAQNIKQAAENLEQLYQQQYDKVLHDTYKRLAEYLSVAQSRRDGPDTVKFDVIVDGDDLNPEVLLKWQEFLDLTEKANSPVFTLWHQLAKFPDDQFASQAPALLQQAVRNKNSDPLISLIASHLLTSKLESFQDVILSYEKLFKNIDQEWDNWIVEAPKPGHETNQKPLAPQKQTYLQAFYSPDSPLVTPRHGFTILKLFPDRKLQKKVQELNAALDTARAGAPVELAQMLSLQDAEQIIEPRVFRRGNPGMPAQSIPRRYLSFFNQVSDKPFTQGSGRLELAKAIASPQNPLTARVIVNRVWQHHFGQGIVSTPSDFGIQGAAPSHPELLDHLASWFMQNGWSIKKLHRYIMQSATYQQQSISHATGEKLDPANKLLWRMNRRRQDFETMRDSLLQVSHQLNFNIGGKSINGITANSNQRRTLYTSINRQNVPGLLRIFDFPSPDVSSGNRNSTSVPGQSLFLMNHPLVLKSAQILGEEASQVSDPTAGISQLYQNILQRAPTQEELSDMLAFLKTDQVPTKQAPTASQWEYGYGAYDLKSKTLSNFKTIPYWNGKQYQGGDRLPDPKIGWVFLDQTGGHPGNDLKHVAVIRWRAPETMTVSIKGSFKHELPQGNGVRGRVLIAGKQALGPWTIHQKSVETNLDQVKLKKDQTIDFIVDIADQLGFDSFIWSPEITVQPVETAATSKTDRSQLTVRHWNYSQDFREPDNIHITPWQSLAQILLLSNEFQFID
ncbi:PSD1 and planctomycete cytochrome C domain-containing protein [uncultured Gimesia sp.]|uniref:PSD1 and planctomycete cytochrome C domain-containing protein n=1 Tax=uncultured Gimesia sp. TaxID=1678688 RepID=UPI0030DA35D9|tara:strand:+ start:46952 stop:50344 length:3393 start_codon:yes stop_codon:yes gene_type:complete